MSKYMGFFLRQFAESLLTLGAGIAPRTPLVGEVSILRFNQISAQRTLEYRAGDLRGSVLYDRLFSDRGELAVCRPAEEGNLATDLVLLELVAGEVLGVGEGVVAMAALMETGVTMSRGRSWPSSIILQIQILQIFHVSLKFPQVLETFVFSLFICIHRL